MKTETVRSRAAAGPAGEGNLLFPVFLKLEQLKVLVVGGGKVGLEKLNALLSSNPAADITVVAVRVIPQVQVLIEEHPSVKLHLRAYEPRDLEGKDIAIVAVNSRELSKAIKADAELPNVLVNVADTPDLCDFYLGSVVKKGDLKIAVSTNGKSPTMAKRVKEVLNDAFPEETGEVLENLAEIRTGLKGDFSSKVKQLNEITSVLVKRKERSLYRKILTASVYSATVILLMILGHVLITYVPWTSIGDAAVSIAGSIDSNIWIYIAGGFVAQMIDGALGMAYGVSVTTFLLSLGIPAITPAVASASMHASEVFTTGSSSLVYMRYRNVNMKLFRRLVIPGAIGAVLGAVTVAFISKEYMGIVKPVVAVYTLVLGLTIIIRAIRVSNRKARKIKRIIPVAAAGGFLDSVGGGGWGPIVTTSLIAGGRNLRYAVGSSHLAKFFVALISTFTFMAVIGLDHWQIIFGLVVGGMVAAPVSIYFSSKIPTKAGLVLVGIVVIAVSLRIIILAFL